MLQVLKIFMLNAIREPKLKFSVWTVGIGNFGGGHRVQAVPKQFTEAGMFGSRGNAG